MLHYLVSQVTDPANLPAFVYYMVDIMVSVLVSQIFFATLKRIKNRKSKSEIWAPDSVADMDLSSWTLEAKKILNLLVSTLQAQADPKHELASTPLLSMWDLCNGYLVSKYADIAIKVDRKLTAALIANAAGNDLITTTNRITKEQAKLFEKLALEIKPLMENAIFLKNQDAANKQLSDSLSRVKSIRA
jgi:hypothetical protein